MIHRNRSCVALVPSGGSRLRQFPLALGVGIYISRQRAAGFIPAEARSVRLAHGRRMTSSTSISETCPGSLLAAGALKNTLARGRAAVERVSNLLFASFLYAESVSQSKPRGVSRWQNILRCNHDVRTIRQIRNLSVD